MWAGIDEKINIVQSKKAYLRERFGKGILRSGIRHRFGKGFTLWKAFGTRDDVD